MNTVEQLQKALLGLACCHNINNGDGGVYGCCYCPYRETTIKHCVVELRDDINRLLKPAT